MAFQDMSVGAKYALIGGIAVLITLLLVLGRFLWARRRKQQKLWQFRGLDANKNIEAAAVVDEKKPAVSNSLPTLPRGATQAPISGPVRPKDDEDHKEEYSRTAGLMPPPAVPAAVTKVSRPHPSELTLGTVATAPARLHPSRERQASVHSEFSNVPTEFNIAQRSPRLLPPQQARHRRNHSEDLTETYLPVPTSTSHQQPRSITPPSPSIYSPGIERAPSTRLPRINDNTLTSPLDGGITSPSDDDLYIRVPRLYQPPSMAYGEADLPYSPPRRNKPHGAYQPGGSLRRKRSVSMQDHPSAMLRMNSNASGSSSVRRKNSRRGPGDRLSTQSEWVDTLTVIDDMHEGDEPATPKRILSPATQRQLLMPRGSSRRGSVKKTKSLKHIPNPIQTSNPASNTSWNNSIIAEQAAAIKYSTKRTRSKSPPKGGRKADA
ncbi:hypothetical protein TWF730_003306 [Orbilia blumenaviensis]|uniref:Uncharacterized protein n=1 Tax=Orbilia blumenaviensis TaxID=1796055 RepID=A0AAV9U8F5_9PEZI